MRRHISQHVEAKTAEQFSTFKQGAMNSGVVRKVVFLNEIVIVNETTIMVKGAKFGMHAEAFKQLVKFIGLDSKILESIEKSLGEQVSQKLLDVMKHAIMSRDIAKQQVCLLVNTKTIEIVGIKKRAEGVLSNNAFFDLFEQTMNNHTGMQIKDMSVTPSGGITISVTNTNWEFNVPGVTDEVFQSGLTFINMHDKTIVVPFNERLTCTNGMVTAENGLAITLTDDKAGSLEAFFSAVTKIQQNSQFEDEFKAQIRKLMSTQASYSEMLMCHKALVYNVQDETNLEVAETIESFIPVREMKQAYLAKNVDLNTLKASTHKTIRTMLTGWELVNALTDVASHPQREGLNLKYGNSIFELQRTAGRLAFKSPLDLENRVIQLF